MGDKGSDIARALTSFSSYSRYSTDAELAVIDHASGGVKDDGESLLYMQNRVYNWLTRSSMCENRESCGHTGFVICGIPLPIFMGVMRECRYRSMMQSKQHQGTMYALDTLGKPYRALVALQADDDSRQYWAITIRGSFRPAFYGMLLAGATGNTALAGMVDIRQTSQRARQADGFGDSFYDGMYASHGELRYRQGHMYFTQSTGSEAECKTVVPNDGHDGLMEKRLPPDIEHVLTDRTVAKAKVVITEAARDGSPKAHHYLINKQRNSEGERCVYLVVSSAEGLFAASSIILKGGDSRIFLRKTGVMSRWRDGMRDELFTSGYAAHVHREMLRDAGRPAGPPGAPSGAPRPVRPPPVRPAGPRGPAPPYPDMHHAHTAPPGGVPNHPPAPPHTRPPHPHHHHCPPAQHQKPSWKKQHPDIYAGLKKAATGVFVEAVKEAIFS